MKLLFFDMEFANGQVPGSIYSVGYLQTKENFAVKIPQTDLLINPDCKWNDYVRTHILAYPMHTVRSAPLFPKHYRKLKRLFKKSGLIVGFAVGNDTNALKKDCERYHLPNVKFSCLDLERLCKKLGDHPEAHGLDGYVRAYCNVEPANRHRSDGDAYATMLLMQKICEMHHLRPKQIKTLHPDCFVESFG